MQGETRVTERPVSLLATTEPPRAGDPIWIIEDDFKTSSALSWHFELAGFEVVQMLEVAEVERQVVLPSFVVLDISLSGGDAIDVIKLLHAKQVGAPIQIVSAMPVDVLDSVADVGRRRGLNVLPALRKPVAPDDLCQTALDMIRWQADARAEQGRPLAPPPRYASRPASQPIELGHALRSGWLDVHFQPKVDLRTGTVVGAECLSRIKHPTRGLVMPDAFLRDARQDDLLALTEAVIRRACAEWSDLDAAGHPIRLAVNIPGWTLSRLPLVQLLREVSPRSPRWPGLILELTEEDALGDIDSAREIGAQLKIYDAYFSIDDFGLGYSSLGRLREIPFREIKLDRSLVDGCAEDSIKASLCRSVIELAHSFGAVAVAEGVEHEADLACLRKLRCDVAQGYVFAKPMTKRDLFRQMSALAKSSARSRLLDMAARPEPDGAFERTDRSIAQLERKRRPPLAR